MSFNYYDKNNNIRQLNIEVGKEWSSYKEDYSQSKMNSVFDAVDLNFDGKVNQEELDLFHRLLKIVDSKINKTKNNNIIEQEELELLDAKLDDEFERVMLLETNLRAPKIIEVSNNKFQNYTYYLKFDDGMAKKTVIDYSSLNDLEKGKYYIKDWHLSVNKNDGIRVLTPEVVRVLDPNLDTTDNWSEGINRYITKIQFDSKGIKPDLKEFMDKVGEEQGFIVELIDAPNQWIEDYGVLRADKKQLIPYYGKGFSEEIYEDTAEIQQIISSRKDISTGRQGAAAQTGSAEKYSMLVSQYDVIQGKTYLEGGNVLNTLTKNGKRAAVIGEESLQYTMIAMGLEDSKKSRKIAKKQIAQELGLKTKNVTYIQQFDFHIDMYYRPLNNGQMGVPDYEAGINVLRELVQALDREIDAKSQATLETYKQVVELQTKNNLIKQKQQYLELIQQLESTKYKTDERAQKAEEELKNKGYEIVKIPCFSVTDQTNILINYMNGICGTSAKTGDKFYITNTSGDEKLDAYMETYFKEKLGFNAVYFAPSNGYLRYQGGIDCLTKEF